MSTDRELLELAAKAINGIYDSGTGCISLDGGIDYEQWEPLDDAGDAFRLAAALQFSVDFENGSVWGAGDLDMTRLGKVSVEQPCFRRAIVEAAAEIGRSMP
ncbi:hypothetical protein FXN65_10580 [Metapseudomonas lalkuanensis]|uniref:DUF2591 domain-containing protein n=1 Tax=Metapseudomonas lalkuanensis TaxID=2604832 RepID=A0A5J6QPH4_9GAMM|nr:hypothetical protein [Pseudomonas lalkuanensis]QEY62499.1 hypothetical protein FXN65_10580 [Pseudomonas lalkuanensis]